MFPTKTNFLKWAKYSFVRTLCAIYVLFLIILRCKNAHIFYTVQKYKSLYFHQILVKIC